MTLAARLLPAQSLIKQYDRMSAVRGVAFVGVTQVQVGEVLHCVHHHINQRVTLDIEEHFLDDRQPVGVGQFSKISALLFHIVLSETAQLAGHFPRDTLDRSDRTKKKNRGILGGS